MNPTETHTNAPAAGDVLPRDDGDALDLLPHGSAIVHNGVVYIRRDADPAMRLGAGWSLGTNHRYPSHALAQSGPSTVLHVPGDARA